MKIIEYLKQAGLFLFGEANLDHLNYPYLIFLISTASVGLLCVLLDFAYYKTNKGKSLLNLVYIGTRDTLLIFLFWGIGSGIVGFLAVRLELMAFSIQASIIMGLAWPFLFPKLYSYAKANIEDGEIEELHSEEKEVEPEEDIEEEPEEDIEEN